MSAMKHQIHGCCHCGSFTYRLTTTISPFHIEARCCDCSFCRKHDARNWSDPNGSVIIQINNQSHLQQYRFAVKTADFYLCRQCGVYVGAVLSEGEQHWSTINLRLSDLVVNTSPASYGTEDTVGRIARRKKVWTPTSLVVVR